MVHDCSRPGYNLVLVLVLVLVLEPVARQDVPESVAACYCAGSCNPALNPAEMCRVPLATSHPGRYNPPGTSPRPPRARRARCGLTMRDSNPPPSPTEASAAPEELEALVAIHLATLFRSGLGVRLLERFGGARRVVAADPAALRGVDGVTASVVRRLAEFLARRAGARELRAVSEIGARVVGFDAPGYPSRLTCIDAPPLALFVQSAPGLSLEAPARRCIAIVGSRRPSLYGRRQARRFARWLARRGVVSVSGLARGTDAEAHRGALEADGATWGVVGTGLGRVYPRENTELAREIVRSEGGALISEYPADTTPRSFHFPMRNRLISGLADAVLVVEASTKSGSLITVRHALEQGKPVFVLPGRVDREESRGCLELLRDGAAPALEPADILLGLLGTEALLERDGEKDDDGDLPLPGTFGARLEALFREHDAWRAEEIAARIDASLPEAMSELSRLESAGHLRRLPGGLFAKP